MKYKGYALVFTEVEADNDEQARKKIADKLSYDYFTSFTSDEIVLDKDANDMTHMFDGVTAEMWKDAFKGWTVEEMLKAEIEKYKGDRR